MLGEWIYITIFLVIIIIGLIAYFYHQNHKPVHNNSNDNDDSKQNEAEKQHSEKFNRITKELQNNGMTTTFLYFNKGKLVDMLDDDEHIIDAISGWGEKNASSMILTENRIILIEKNNCFGKKNNEVPLDMLNSISSQSKVMSSKIKVTNGANSMWIKSVPLNDANKFVENARKRSRQFKRNLMRGNI